MRVVAAPDKFRATLTAAEAARAIERGVRAAAAECRLCPLADGGEGTLEVLGGPNRSTWVSGPLGDPVEAGWRLQNRSAVVEMARASGMALVGEPADNDAVAASTYGTGELIAAALDAGAREIVVGVGGSATTDGGLGAIGALHPLARLRGVRFTVACDVRLEFGRAAEVFAGQKGASPVEIEFLSRRLTRLREVYLDTYGIDVGSLEFAGAGGGLAGGLAAVGATLESGFDVVADAVGLDDLLEDADLVVTGEGHLDAESFDGKVVGGVLERAAEFDVGVLVVVGEGEPSAVERVRSLGHSVVTLVDAVGPDAALDNAADALADVVASAVGG